MEDQNRYVFYNPNPRGIKVGDCVIRAIAKVLKMPWDKVYAEMMLIKVQNKNVSPKEKVQELLNSGQMSQQDFNTLREIANQITGKNY